MSNLVINTNIGATIATANLNKSNGMLTKSLERLSSGYKMNAPGDDAGGFAVSMKMEAAIKRNMVAQDNIGNAVSFLQTQDGAMGTVSEVLKRVSELAMLYTDSTKSSADLANYNTEFTALQGLLVNLEGEQFNGVSVFATSSATFNVVISDDGSSTVSVTKSNINSALSGITGASGLSASAVSVANTVTAIQSIATLRAQNGAETNRLEFASQMLVTNKTNLEASNSRIKDADIAAESTNFAKFNILMQSGTAMLAQAKALPRAALSLLQ